MGAKIRVSGTVVISQQTQIPPLTRKLAKNCMRGNCINGNHVRGEPLVFT